MRYTEEQLFHFSVMRKPIWFSPEQIEWSQTLRLIFFKWGEEGERLGRCLIEDASIYIQHQQECGIYKELTPIFHNGTYAYPLEKKDDIWFFSIKSYQLEQWELLREGDLQKAKVRDIGSEFLFADLIDSNGFTGLDLYMKREDLSKSRIINTRDLFQAGDEFWVKITAKYSSNYHIRGIRINQAEPLQLQRGSVTSVTLTSQIEDGWYCEVNPEVKGIVDTHKIHNPGDRIMARVKKITPKGVKLNEMEPVV